MARKPRGRFIIAVDFDNPVQGGVYLRRTECVKHNANTGMVVYDSWPVRRSKEPKALKELLTRLRKVVADGR